VCGKKWYDELYGFREEFFCIHTTWAPPSEKPTYHCCVASFCFVLSWWPVAHVILKLGTRRFQQMPRQQKQPADVSCEDCGAVYNDAEWLQCNKCSDWVHGPCAEVDKEKLDADAIRIWMCMDCILCYVCRQERDEEKLLVCESCERGYHYDTCLKEPYSELPEGKWVCELCLDAQSGKRPKCVTHFDLRLYECSC
jgi:hypothetical protein